MTRRTLTLTVAAASVACSTYLLGLAAGADDADRDPFRVTQPDLAPVTVVVAPGTAGLSHGQWLQVCGWGADVDPAVQAALC